MSKIYTHDKRTSDEKSYLIILITFLLATYREDFVREDNSQPEITEESVEIAFTQNEITVLSQTIEDNVVLSSSELGDNALETKTKPLCPEVSVETENLFPFTITVDYKDSCKIKRNHDISVKVFIEMSSSWITEGAIRTVTFDEFEIDGIQVSGTTTTKGEYSMAINLDRKRNAKAN